MTRTIDFVYFDLGNILVSFDPRIACQNLAELFDAPPADGRKAVYDSGLAEQFEHGQITPPAFAGQIRDFFAAAESAVSNGQILAAVSDMFTPIRSMEGVLQSVRNTGRGVGLLSNTCVAHWQWIQEQRYDVIDFDFDSTILSFEVGSMKPQRQIYEAAEQACATCENGILFIDDRPENVATAQSRGWIARQCLGGAEAIAVLEDLGVMEPAN